MNIVLGLLFLRERMSRLQIVATLIAAAAVVYLTIAHGTFPWISVGLAVTFGLYGLAKKTTPLDSISGLALESLFLLPLAGGYVVYLGAPAAAASLAATRRQQRCWSAPAS